MPPDAAAIMESTRAMGYSLETAIADIIDNSIAAEATRVEIFYSPTDKYIATLDNGFGMSSQGITRAMKYGGVSPLETRHEKDLGRFGLGMKTASLSQCEILTVVSKQGGNISARCWNLNEVRRRNSWALIELSPEEIECIPKFDLLKNLSSGTLVVWQELNRMLQGSSDFERKMPDKMNAVRDHLALVFHRYLNGEDDLNKLSIFVNNLAIEPSDPFLRNKNTQAQAVTPFLIDGQQIKIVPYVLPFPSRLSKTDKKLLGITADLQKNQGIYVYRNKRLIVWGKWFRLQKREKLSQLARIQIDIPPAFDSLWVLDVKKSFAIPPAVVCRNLDAMIEKISEKSRRTWVWRGRKETDKKIYPLWNRIKTRDGGIVYEINEKHPIFRRLIEKFPACEKDFKSTLKSIAAEFPFTQLTIDLSGDKNKIQNVGLYSEDDVQRILQIYIDGLTHEEANKLLDNLEQEEPYKNFPQIIEKFRKDAAYD